MKTLITLIVSASIVGVVCKAYHDNDGIIIGNRKIKFFETVIEEK